MLVFLLVALQVNQGYMNLSNEHQQSIFFCDFDDSNNHTACNETFTYETTTATGYQAGVFKSSDTVSSSLKYYVTDYKFICKNLQNFFTKKHATKKIFL